MIKIVRDWLFGGIVLLALVCAVGWGVLQSVPDHLVMTFTARDGAMNVILLDRHGDRPKEVTDIVSALRSSPSWRQIDGTKAVTPLAHVLCAVQVLPKGYETGCGLYVGEVQYPIGKQTYYTSSDVINFLRSMAEMEIEVFSTPEDEEAYEDGGEGMGICPVPDSDPAPSTRLIQA